MCVVLICYSSKKKTNTGGFKERDRIQEEENLFEKYERNEALQA